jgi:hypothetical protein
MYVAGTNTRLLGRTWMYADRRMIRHRSADLPESPGGLHRLIEPYPHTGRRPANTGAERVASSPVRGPFEQGAAT